MLDFTQIRKSAGRDGTMSRRLFMAYSTALSALPLLGIQSSGAPRRVRFAANPFGLGVASGDPDASSAVLWTRLAPKPLEPFGGMDPELVEVRWELADDEGMTKVVNSGTAVATPQLGHSVHVEVNGLKPDRWYWYRFRIGDADSPIGRTRTLPALDAKPDQLRFAFASCQHFEQGLFTAYDHMAKEDLDLVVHLGDYIYEGPGSADRLRKHLGGKLNTLADYRLRYCQYKSDPLLMKAHARFPWIVTWDDHEVENNYAADRSERKRIDPVDFLEMRANSYQAYYEMMPLRKRSFPCGPDLHLYRKLAFGNLAEFFVLDTRQYRSPQPNGDQLADLNWAAWNAHSTLLGPKQKGWLMASLLQSKSTWNVLAQQIMMGMVDLTKGPDHKYSMDQWPGYAYERVQLARFLADRRVPNPIVLTGDIHSNWVNDLHVDDTKPETPIVASEFVGTSISSGGNGADKSRDHDSLLSENPFVKYHNRQRGYVHCTVTPKSWKSDYRIVPDVVKPNGSVVTGASFVVENGKRGVSPA
jgi:alkaline phosphatase D